MLKNTFVMIALVLISASAFADTAPAAPKAEGPCKKIEDACLGAGFIKGEAKEGKGLWVDCIDPIMQGSTQPAKAVMKLPAVAAADIAACTAKHPNFGQKKKK